MSDGTTTLPAKAVANHFIDLAKANSSAISPMKMQKLIYFAHGWHLAFTDNPLVKERIEAWKFGPVVETIYHEFKEFGNDFVSRYARDIELLDGGKFRWVEPRIGDSPIVNKLLGQIWDVYGKYSAVQLSNATHLPGTPWYIVWEERGGKDRSNTDIPDELIKEHFKAKLNAQQPAKPAEHVAA